MEKDDVIIPKGMERYYDTFHFAPAVRAGGRLLASGQLGTDAAGAVSADPETQFEQAFRNVSAVLGAAGLGLDAVVEMTTYHVGLQQHLRTFMRVKDRHLREPYPAWTAIGVSELAFPGALVEIRVTAALGR